MNARRPSTRFRISYVGSLYGARDAAPVFAALRALLDRGVIDERLLELRIVGPAALGGDANLDRLPVTRKGYVDHAAAISEMAAADVLLFFAPTVTGYRPARSTSTSCRGGRSYAWPGATTSPSNSCRSWGRVLRAASDLAAIEDALERLYLRWQDGKLDISPDVRGETLRRFSRPRSLERSPACSTPLRVNGPRFDTRHRKRAPPPDEPAFGVGAATPEVCRSPDEPDPVLRRRCEARQPLWAARASAETRS